MMIKRPLQALNNNQEISSADASFYFHELREAELMQQGLTYDEFNKKRERAWGIT